MALSEPLRRQYLAAMDIREWSARASAASPAAVIPTPVVVAEPAATYLPYAADAAVNAIAEPDAVRLHDKSRTGDLAPVATAGVALNNNVEPDAKSLRDISRSGGLAPVSEWPSSLETKAFGEGGRATHGNTLIDGGAVHLAEVTPPREGVAAAPRESVAAAGGAVDSSHEPDAMGADSKLQLTGGLAPVSESAAPREPVVPMDWPALEAAVRGCTKCRLHATRTQTVFGVGNRSAQWLFVGEAPGADEDRQGEPFVGRAGQLLNAMLFALGLKREDVFICNVLKCRPPGNRDPQDDEAAACEPYLLRQIELINPRMIVALGRHAAHSLLKTDLALAKLRGRRLQYHDIPLIATYHPAYLLRSPADKRKAWEDLRLARDIVEGAAP